MHKAKICHSLIVESTAAAGGVAKLGECLSDILVELIGKEAWHALPCQDDNNNDSVGTMVPCPMAHQTQQLLLLAAAPDHLRTTERKGSDRER